MADLGAWVTERYRIAGESVDPDAEDDPALPDKGRE
jgi:endogenous inhibitor of DNA gyrase (YacG/DUF329 family)